MVEGIGDSRIYYEGCASSPLILGQWRGQNQGCRGAGVAHHWIWVSFLENKLPLCQSSSRIEGGLSTAGLFFPELGLETQPFEDVGHCQPNFREQLIDQAGDKKRDPLVHRADLDVTLRIVAQGGLPAVAGRFDSKADSAEMARPQTGSWPALGPVETKREALAGDRVAGRGQLDFPDWGMHLTPEPPRSSIWPSRIRLRPDAASQPEPLRLSWRPTSDLQ